jgi:RNA polymerase sigma factor (sigma-70 family)
VHVERPIEDLLRDLAPQVLGALVRRYGHFDAAEDAMQEALLAAATQWQAESKPDDPRAWLIQAASRRLIDQLRSEQSRRRREEAVAVRVPRDHYLSPAADAVGVDRDDSLMLLFLCCHPVLTAASQVALTLRAVGGLTTAEIARAYVVPEATMAQRISRAKQRVSAAGATFRLPEPDRWRERLDAVLQVLYLIFNEGHTTTAGERLYRVDLSAEAIRLTRMLSRLVPDDNEVAGLLALMLLTDARRPARTGPDGALVPMAEQDRSRWDRLLIAEGVELVTAAMSRPPLGPYQLQAAIAAVHAEAPSLDATDWKQIVGLYGLLERMGDPVVNPMITLNRAVAIGMAYGPRAGLGVVAGVVDRLADHHRLHAVRAHLLETAGETAAASAEFREAARRATSRPEQRYLAAQATRLARQE